MRKSRLSQLWLPVFFSCVVLGSPRNIGDKKELIRQARGSYYNLPGQGLFEAQSTVTPNWAAFLRKELKSDIPPDHPALKLLNGVHFWLSLDQKGAAKISHRIDATPANQKSIADLHQSVSGVEEMLDGFAKGVNPFLFTSPFPAVDSDYSLEEVDDQYRLIYKQGQFDTTTTMTKDFAIKEMDVAGPEFRGSMKPQFTKTDKGFLITAYDSTYQSASAKRPDWLSVQIDYAEVEGLQLPERVSMNTSSDAGTFKWELLFSAYQVKKRSPWLRFLDKR